MAFENYLIHLGILITIYSILTISLNLSLGFTGLMNLGHIAFFGIGAYTSALVAIAGYPLWFSILAGAMLSGIIGLILGLPTARLKGDYLALALLGFVFILGSVARNLVSVTRGALGIPGIPTLTTNPSHFLILGIIISAIIYCISYYISISRFGRILEAIRDDELAAQVLGHNTFLYKIAALALSAGFAGIAGGLYAHYISYIDPTIFGLGDLILVFSMLIIGGLGSVKGSFVGTALLLLIPEPLRFLGFPSSIIGPIREILFAVILLCILRYKPRGIFGKVDIL
ncbi:MAG: branched-chain amino acid ABC transporter permease [Nanoarchaeota archaeon]